MSRSARPLARLLKSWLKASGLERVVSGGRLQQDWVSIVGARISAVSRPIDVRGETLVIEVEDPVWRNELSLIQDTILTRVNAHPDGPEVKRIRFVGRRGGGTET